MVQPQHFNIMYVSVSVCVSVLASALRVCRCYNRSKAKQFLNCVMFAMRFHIYVDFYLLVRIFINTIVICIICI